MRRLEFTLDRYTRGLLSVIAVLLAIIAVELWQGRPNLASDAVAQIPDAGAQRNAAIAEAQRTNQLLQDILDHLRTKRIKVEMPAEADDKSTTVRPGKR